MNPDSSGSRSMKLILVAAQRIADPCDRSAYLDEACGSDQKMRGIVEGLLAGAAGGISSPLDDVAEQPQQDETVSLTPSSDEAMDISSHPMIGPYKLLEMLGEGGMGTVYMAQQKTPVKRKVALKLIKPGMDSKEVVARFEAERQALAMMNHSNIAHIFGAGMTEKGRPYFVMELVRDFRIDRFCEDSGLKLNDRLMLFIDVCRAIQHAHQKGIIHRDLKPSNILVTLHDGVPVVKVIDFGIAKALEYDLTERTLFTHFAELIGTPVYMSPEQAEMSGLDIDTRSDVYSLGVLLYKLLTGVTPFDRKTLDRATFDEMRRIIREDEPARPSRRISTLKAQQRSTVVQRQRVPVPEFDRQIRRELDWIVMKALEKDRNRRYESASALATDIERYLNDEPVEAVPPSTTYQFRKFARRHRTMIVTTGLVAAALIVGTAVSVWQALAANDARQLANDRFIEADEQRKNAERAAEQARQNEEFSQELVYAADVTLAAQAWHTGDVRRFTDLLDRHAPVEGKPDRRGFEWWYLRQFGTADFRDIATQTGGSCVARFSPNGKYLVTGQHDGTLCFRDGQSSNRLATLPGHEGLVRGIDFSPDGKRMASIGDDGIIRLWDPAELKLIHRFQAHPDHGFRVFFVLQGSLLASCGEDTSVRLWNSTTGESVGELEGFARTVERAAMARSPDGQLCASGDPYGDAYVWDAKTRKRLCELDLGHREGVRCKACCVCFSPDGKLLASSDLAGVIRLWPLNADGTHPGHDFDSTNEWPPYFQGHSSRAWSLDFSPDGTRLISTSNDGNVRCWSGSEPIRQHISGTGPLTNEMAFMSSEGNLIIAENDKIQTWNRQTDKTVPFGTSFDERAFSVAVSPNGQTCVTGHAAGIIRIWSCRTERITRTLTGHAGNIERITFSPDGQLLATGSWDGTARLWDMVSGEELAVFHMPPHCYDVAFSPNGRVLAFSSESDATLFDVASRRRLHLLQGHRSSAECVVFSPDGKTLATGSADRTIRLWSVDTGEVLHEIAAHRDGVLSLTFSPDGQTIASGGRQGTIAFSHVETGRVLLDTKVGNAKIFELQFSPDGQSLAVMASGNGQWDRPVGQASPCCMPRDLKRPNSQTRSTDNRHLSVD